MSIKMHYACDGCFEESFGSNVSRRFESLDGKGYGFGRYVINSDPEKLAPQGWVAFDLVGATYCPKCAAELFSDAGEGER